MEVIHITRRMISIAIIALMAITHGFANTETKPIDVLVIQNLQEYLAAEYMADNSVLVYFNYSQEEFEGYVDVNQITEFQVEIYGVAADGTMDDLLQTQQISPTATIENWSLIVTESEINNNGSPYESLYAVIHINGNQCPEGVILDPEPFEEMEPLECGEDIVEEIDPNSPPGTIKDGESYTINGFPFIAEGTTHARLSLPFGNSVILVELIGIEVNAAGQVTAGSVAAVADNGANFTLDRYVSTKKSNGSNENSSDICVPPPPPPGYNEDGTNMVTGLDDWGFGSDGIHSETNTPYDRQGFDQDGIHRETGTPFNDDGCSREGLDEAGNECELFYGVNPEAEAYVNENSAELINTISQLAADCTSQLQTDFDAKTTECQALRDRMIAIVDNPLNELPSDLIFGTDNQYLEPGMSNNFSAEPIAIGESTPRNMEVVELEEKHVALYHCDRQQLQLESELMNANELPEGYEDQILELMTFWTEYDFQLYGNDEAARQEWIKAQVEAIASEQGTAAESDEGNFVAEDQKDSEIRADGIDEEYLNQKVSDIFAFKRNVFGVEQPVYISEKKSYMSALLNEYAKGVKSIDGVDRVYYTRQIYEQKSLSDDEDAHNILPLKLTNSNSDKPYDIFIERVEIGVTGASLDAVILIEDTKNGGHIVFRGENIGFGTGGLSGGADSYLRLDSEVGIRLNNAAKLHLLPDDTYVRWDCHGFQAIGIGAEIEFCPEFIKPVINGLVSDTENYRLAVTATEVSNWNEFHFELNATPFVLTKYETVIWELQSLVADFSTTVTNPTTTLPGYMSPFADAGGNLSNEWEGFYIQNLSATIPKDFSGDISESTETFEVGVSLAIIDGSGFTGEGFVETTLVDIGEGNLNGWGFSIEEFYLRVVNNHFAGTGFGGQIQLPIIEDPMPYTAEMFPGDKYKFAVEPITDSESKLFNAMLNIDNSYVEISKDENGFNAFADITGSLSFQPGMSNDTDFNGINFPSLSFTNFQISNQAPYFSPGTWSTDGTDGIGVGFGGFKIELNNIKPYQPAEEETVGLGFNLALILNDEANISAEGALGIVGELTDDNGRQKWEYKNLELHSLYVDAPIGSVAHIKGGIVFEKNDDPEWGNYFQGALEVELKKIAKTTVTGLTQFGSKNDEKYFYVDVLVDLPVSIPAGPVEFTALGLGIYRNVTYDNGDVSIATLLNNVGGNPLDNFPQPGLSLSGGVYSHDSGVSFGIKGIAQFKTASEQMLNGTVALGAEFMGTTLSRLYLNGSAQFLATLNSNIKADLGVLGDVRPASVTVPMSAYVSLEMDFQNTTFTGDIGTYMNTPLLKGAGNDGAVVLGKIHFSPGEWYIKIGSPTNRAGLILSIPNAFSASATGYFQVGTNTDPIADLPDKVRELAYTASRNQSLLTSGQGMIFGAQLEIQGGIGLSGVVEAELYATAGFDLMLRRYEGLSCAGQDDEIGINGWYASGQMYAMLDGSIEVFGIKLFSAGVATVLQAQLPNPFFAEATVAVRAKLAFITINKSLSISIGNQCQIEADDPAAVFGADVIASITPGNNEQEVSVAAQPRVVLNFPLRKKVTMPSLNGGEAQYEVRLKSASASSAGVEDIPISANPGIGALEFDINPIITLPPNEEITVTIVVDLFQNGDHLGEQEKTVTFTTGKALTDIPVSNVRHAYPWYNQENYHTQQYHSNFIELISGQPDLFDGTEVKLFLKSTFGSEQEIPVSYDYIDRRVEFTLPDQLPNEAHTLDLVQIVGGDRHILHTIDFGVSQYVRFADKVSVLEANAIIGKFSIFRFDETEGLSPFEITNVVDASFGISSSQENQFLSQFDTFGECGLCSFDIEAILGGAEIQETNITGTGIVVTYEGAYSRIHNGLTTEMTTCVAETCGNDADCDNPLLISQQTKSLNPLCDINPFIGLPGGAYKVFVNYKIPGANNSNHQISFAK